MPKIPIKFNVKLTFPVSFNKDYASTILLCKEIPTFIESKKKIELNEVVLNELNIDKYYHKFLFIANITINYRDVKLIYNNKIIVPSFLHNIYVQSNDEVPEKEKSIEKSYKDEHKTYKEDNSTENENSSLDEVKSNSLLDELREGLLKTKTTEERKRDIPKVKFNDIGGISNILQEIRESIELPLKIPQLFKHLGIKPHRGILLYGEPGCGKTLIAKAIANETNAHFIAVNASELYSMWTGNSESNLRQIFEETKERQPSVIYFDEIDSIGRKRTGEETGRHDARFLTQLLTLLDGMKDYGDVCVVGSTNRN